ncbi:putative bifunctional diguanylate cyclase/phosphodiesterase [Sphingomonas sp. MMS24-J13]|uniref:putative bifunctional diguanylate cyclase/phosphodiesterase n=1 Tax=Sphingomonas sp. MMS24-J13 TaxID=3238686 RepID=UPI00384BB9D1
MIFASLHVWPQAAQAQTIELRSSLCAASAPAGPPASDSTLAHLRFVCGTAVTGPDYHDRWVWLRLDRPSALRDLPTRWQLRIDQARFDRIAIVAVARDGRSQRIVRGPGDLAGHWSPGGLLRFAIDRPGADLAQLYIGFDRLDDLGLMRKVTAAAPAQAVRIDAGWLLLIGLFAGAILSAATYNLLIYTGQRYAFQRWYLIWAGVTLAYGLTWTNAAAFFLPGFVGPWAVRADFVLVGAMIFTGNNFLLAVLEDGMVPPWLQRVVRTIAVIGLLCGIVASADYLLPAAMTDHWMNYAIFASAISAVASVTFAIRRGSRTVYFYLGGWLPPSSVFLLRLARNLGLLGQNDIVDMATFASIAFESVVLSLAIADRFRLLRRERDLAEQAHNAIAIETETLRRAAHTDFLTGLQNRAAFQIALQALIEREDAQDFTLFLVDVDHLKAVNDRLGHDGGDALLAHVARRLVAAVGPAAHVARIGGDEFSILLPADKADADIAAAALDALQDEQTSHAGRGWPISLSIGSAQFRKDATDTATLYKNADLALYRAKRLGRRRRQAYDPSLRAQIDRKAAFVRDAYVGLERGEFAIHFQPIVDLADGRAIGHEALLRWHHPDLGLLTPAIFGDILTDGRIGLLVQERVLALALAELRGQANGAGSLSVNFTGAQLRGTRAAQRLLDRIAAAGIRPADLCIELTEGIVLERAGDDILSALHMLHCAGVRIALDDFGTGYASLIHLKQMPVDTLKIDRSFVLGLLEDGGQSEEIVRAIIGLGHGLRKTVVAEGIETPAQRQRLRELGCHFGQGYLFARPGPVRMDTGPAEPLEAERRTA